MIEENMQNSENDKKESEWKPVEITDQSHEVHEESDLPLIIAKQEKRDQEEMAKIRERINSVNWKHFWEKVDFKMCADALDNARHMPAFPR